MIRFLKSYFISRKLKACMKPDPLYRKRRLAQFDEARRARYHANVRAVFDA